MFPHAPVVFPNRGGLLAVAVVCAFALGAASSAFSRDREADLVINKTPQGYSFLSGGIGVEERHKMTQEARLYDLELSFANSTGQYLSDVRVVINDDHGRQIVDTTTNGPWFYIELPAGKYDVKATFAHQTKSINGLNISKDRATTRLLHWNLGASTVS